MSTSQDDQKSVPTASGGEGGNGRVRSSLIFAAIGVFAAIVFGVIYLFFIAPNVPEGNLGWYLFSFATGLTMIVMPCTLPLAFVIVPLAMGKGMVRGVGMALSFGIGVALMLSLYGVITALLGDAAGEYLGAEGEVLKNWVYFIAGSFALIFALSEIGLLNFHMPSYSGAAPAFIQKKQEFIKAFLLGLFLGNVGVGCPHPATPLILIEIAQNAAAIDVSTISGVLYGWTLFLIHAIGRVIPLLLLAFLAILGVNGLNWLVKRKDAVQTATGWAMVFVAGFILTLGLFTHDWWVNSGLHSGLETITQEHRFNQLLNETLDTDVAHVHGLEEGEGLFGLPLHWGHWFLVLVWLIPIWWWYKKRRKELGDDEESCEAEKLSIKRNFLIAVSIFLVLIFAILLPNNFYYKSVGGGDHHDDHGDDHHDEMGHMHDDSHAHDMSLMGLHAMPDGTIMNADGEVVPGAHQMPDGTIMLADGTTVAGMGGMMAPTHNGTPFTASTAGLQEAQDIQFVELEDGDTYDMVATYVKKEVGNRTLRMLAYNGSIPGPFIKAPKGSTVTINFTNDTDIDQTIHHHGLRIDNRYDGVPYVTQDPVKPGESFTYEVNFKDEGMAWYHPHTRDDYGQEMGLYGVYLIEPLEGDYWNPVNREVPLVIDDILIENDAIATFYEDVIDHVLLGRFGNEYLVNGETNYELEIEEGETIRFQVTNTSNARTYRLTIPGIQMKVVGAEWGRYEEEEFVDEFLISPAERVVFEAHFPKEGDYELINRMGSEEVELAEFEVEPAESNIVSYEEEFKMARVNTAVRDEFNSFRTLYGSTIPDKELLLTVKLTGMVDHSAHMHGATAGGVDHSQHAHQAGTTGIESIQWDDPTNSDKVNTLANVEWILRDMATGKESMGIPVEDWTFTQGEMVKIRLTNDAKADHVMQHPIHFHGQRFVVLSENGVPNQNMAWKDTVLVLPGEYVDILVEMEILGEWMTHCHISEHLHGGMMLQYRVEDENGYATGDEYRASLPPDVGHSMKASGQEMPDMETSMGSMGMDAMMSGTIPTLTGRSYSYNDSVPLDTLHTIVANTRYFTANRLEPLALSFNDIQGNETGLDDTLDRVLSIYFVKSDDSFGFATYPGNSAFPEPLIPTDDHGHDDGHDHVHSLLGINYAYADAGHGPNEAHGVNQGGRVYSVPVRFPEKGIYRGYVEFIVRGETEPRVLTIDVEVRDSGFTIDSYGWSSVTERLILSAISIILMIPLVLFVRRYLKNVKA